MAVTNLTGTTWVLKDRPDNSTDFSFNITFSSNDTTYSLIKVYGNNPPPFVGDPHLYYDDVEVFDGVTGRWSNEAYKTISITGGADVTNTTLISWLEANGTLTPPEPEPQGETWLFNNAVADFESGTYLDYEDGAYFEVGPSWVAYNGTFISNGITYKGFLFAKSGGFAPPIVTGTSVYQNSEWLSQAYRTIAFEEAPTGDLLTWLQANAVKQEQEQELGYEVTFVTNGGTSVTKLEEVQELPTPLPTTTKANNIFVGWFYDSGFEEQAFSGDTISSNITLYAKWYSNMEDFYEDVADAIRSKTGETGTIKHTDFAYKIKNIQGEL